MSWVYRKQMIEGVSIPGIIHNGNYYFTQLAVYEDGTVSCWQKDDLPKFKRDVERGWVVSQIPIGQELCVHGLADFPVKDAKWLYNKETYYRYIEDIVRELNPEMKNLYVEQPRVTKKWEKARVSWWANPIDCKKKWDFGYDLYDGRSVYIFYQENGKLQLTFLTAYEDKTLLIDAKGDTYYTLDEILNMFDTGELCVSVEKETWVYIKGIGELLLAPPEYEGVELKEKKKEIVELVAEVSHESTAYDRCINAYHAYLVEPTENARERLRETYEEVPEHERMFLGDMDTRDSDIIRILEFPDRKREV